MESKPTPAFVELSPLSNNLLLRPCAPVDRVGLIIVPEAHQKKLNQGVVEEKGPLCTDAIEVGDIVFFGMHTEHQLGYAGQSFTIVAEEACLGRIRKKSK